MKTPQPIITKQDLPSNQEHQDITWFHMAKATKCTSTGRRVIVSTRETRDYNFEKRSLNGFIIHPTNFTLSQNPRPRISISQRPHKKANKPLSNPYVETLEEDLLLRRLQEDFSLGTLDLTSKIGVLQALNRNVFLSE